jgi:2-aminoadipate transaminase
VLRREGPTLATYGLNSGPLGYRPLREFLSGKLKGHAGIDCSPDEILITSGSLQGLDLVNTLLLGKGDTILIEKETYGGALRRLAKFGVNIVGIPLDATACGWMRSRPSSRSSRQGHQAEVHLHHPDGAEPDRLDHAGGAPPRDDRACPRIRRDDLRGRVLFGPGVDRQAAALDLFPAGGEGVIFVGSFSKSIAPSLRVGYIVAKWGILARILGLKQDAGSGALEQMVLAEFCAKHFASHVPKLNKALSHKLQVLREALAEQFGTAAEFGDPPGGIYLWIKLPDNVDTVKLGQAALAAACRSTPARMVDRQGVRPQPAAALLRQPDPATIKKGVEVLAEVCRREFGVPLRSANVEKP